MRRYTPSFLTMYDLLPRSLYVGPVFLLAHQVGPAFQL